MYSKLHRITTLEHFPVPGFEEFRQYMDQRISTQEALLQRIAQELGLDKPKQQ